MRTGFPPNYINSTYEKFYNVSLKPNKKPVLLRRKKPLKKEFD